jgi:hypothetical protein
MTPTANFTFASKLGGRALTLSHVYRQLIVTNAYFSTPQKISPIKVQYCKIVEFSLDSVNSPSKVILFSIEK